MWCGGGDSPLAVGGDICVLATAEVADTDSDDDCQNTRVGELGTLSRDT